MMVNSFNLVKPFVQDRMLKKVFFLPETFKQFLEDNFDDRTYANNIIQSRAISESLARLADGINLLDKELHAQVCCLICHKILKLQFYKKKR